MALHMARFSAIATWSRSSLGTVTNKERVAGLRLTPAVTDFRSAIASSRPHANKDRRRCFSGISAGSSDRRAGRINLRDSSEYRHNEFGRPTEKYRWIIRSIQTVGLSTDTTAPVLLTYSIATKCIWSFSRVTGDSDSRNLCESASAKSVLI